MGDPVQTIETIASGLVQPECSTEIGSTGYSTRCDTACSNTQ
jgi:hypothetical protein